jgi:hypothetical protein
MQSFHLSFEYSAWWLLPIVLVSASLAWLLYSGKNVWTKRLNLVLGTLRFFVLVFVLLLLLNPRLTFVTSYKEKPLFPLVVDNSESIPLVTKDMPGVKATLSTIKEQLEKNGFDVPVFVFDQEIETLDSLSFRHGSSNIASLLGQAEKSMARTQNANLVFLSDGISNSGIAPVYLPYHSHIFSLGIGDTVPRKDIALKSVQNNSVAFLGNKFTIRVEIKSHGYKNKETYVVLKGSKNNPIEKQRLLLEEDNWHGELDFAVPASEKGYQRYTLEVEPLSGENNLINNKLSTYVDVVDDRENVLLVSASPHPNIKAIRAALGKVQNIQLDVFIPGFGEVPTKKTYDLIILHDCYLSSFKELQEYAKESTSLLYITGSQSDFNKFNAENGIVEILSQPQSDLVQAVPNPSFTKFKLNESTGSLLGKLPPIEVPFGELKAKPGTEILFYQLINGVSSSKPLLVFGQSVRKTGVLLSNGLWLWRMQESQINGNSSLVDELIAKSVQYLSSKEDKRKFRIYSHQKEYFEGEAPRIEMELYNDLYEKVYGQKISLQILPLGDQKKYEFVPTENNTSLAIRPLPAGVYKITAQTQFGGKTLSAYTEFIVKERQLEGLDLQANFAMLRQLSLKTKGSFYPWSKKEALIEKIKELKAVPIWKSKEATRELIDEKWYYFLIVLLIAAEWGIRRYTGGY